jgi:hypothetical protein
MMFWWLAEFLTPLIRALADCDGLKVDTICLRIMLALSLHGMSSRRIRVDHSRREIIFFALIARRCGRINQTRA